MAETQTKVKSRGPQFVAGLYQWRDRTGVFRHPCDMETRHLFHTVRMIWNHTMPEKTDPYFRQYTFSKYYTETYMKMSVYHLLRELLNRDDITPEWWATLQWMAGRFGDDHIRQLAERRKELK